jgi:hypothetical protein
MHLWRWGGGEHWHRESDPAKRWESRIEYFLILTPFKSKAEAPALSFARLCWGDPYELNFYPRNYIKQARELARQGMFVSVDPHVEIDG